MNVRVAAYQAPLAVTDPGEAVAGIRVQLDRCEREAVSVLCCPEAILGGLADHAPAPEHNAISAANGQLADVLAPLRSRRVTTIVGFNERGEHGELFNAAAVLHRGKLLGIYRKQRPARRASVYAAGNTLPVFRLGRVAIGILICYDSTFPELAQSLVARGAQMILVPSNNGLPPEKADVVAHTRLTDATLAHTLHVPVVRADVAGRTDSLVALGTTGVTDQDGTTWHLTSGVAPGLLIANVTIARASRRRRRSAREGPNHA